jgi:enoyl-CoA hydratase/carnithine racemase
MSTTTVAARVANGTGCLQLQGETTATLDEASLASFRAELQRLVRDASVERVVVHGSPGRFLAGVDVELFRECLRTGQIAKILAFTRAAHRVLAALANSPKPIVAWIDGPAYGGGMELALACHRIVAGPKAKFCLPETGLGIYPGMGGTQRLPRRIGVGLAKWMIYTGAIVPVDHALAFGLVDVKTGMGATQADALAALEPERDVPACDPRFLQLAEYFSQHSVDGLLDQTRPLPTDAAVVRAIVQLRAAAPRALRLAEMVIDRGVAMPLREGIEEEYARLTEVFSTTDAQIGLAAVGQAKPKFTGA